MSAAATVTLREGAVGCVDRFLSAEECGQLVAEARHSWWWGSPVIRLDRHGKLMSAHSISRTSASTDETWLGLEGRRVVRRAERRLARAIGVCADRFEPWQLTRYRAGERFDEHHDSGFFDGDHWGERTVSVIVYLTDSPSGGSTYFPALGQRFQPVAGRLLVWPNLLADGSVDVRMRHVACPARRVKTILSTWVRELPTRSRSNQRKEG